MPQNDIFELLTINPDSDILSLERALVEKVREKVQQSPEEYNEEELKKEEQEIRHLYEKFFLYTDDRVKTAMLSMSGKSEPKEAQNLRKQALELTGDVQRNLIEFALCYMHIGRNASYVKEQIKKEQDSRPNNQKKVKWSPDMTSMLARLKKRKLKIIEENERLVEACAILERASVHFGIFSEALGQISTSDDKDVLSRRFTSSLRMMRYAKTEKALKDIRDYKKKFSLAGNSSNASKDRAISEARKFMEIIKENDKVLENGEGRLYLHPHEVRMAIEANNKEVVGIRNYFFKYHLPYMEGKVASFNRLRDKLMVMGSIEDLTRLYTRMFKGLTEPLKDFAAIRDYESQAVDQAKYLNSTLFQEIPKIKKDCKKTMDGFLLYMKEHRIELQEYMESTEDEAADGSGAASQ